MATTYSPKAIYHSAARRLHVLDESAVSFSRARATNAAAALAYYTFFSIFPLMLLLVLAGSYFLSRQDVLQRVTQAVQSLMPISQDLVVHTLQQVLKQRAAVGIFVLVSLLWSASGMFNNLAYEINKAWPEAHDRNFMQSRLIGIDMILGLAGLLVISVALDSINKMLAGLSATTPLGTLSPASLLSAVGSWLAVFLLFLSMYRWVPTVSVAWWASFWGALVAAIGWKASTTGFSWYLGSPFAHYALVYGSLGAVIAFLFLIYIIALVTLYGAHLTAALDRLHKARPVTNGAATASPVPANPAAQGIASSEEQPADGEPDTGTDPDKGDKS